MKTFFDLLATKQQLDIQVNNNISQADLHADLEFSVEDLVMIDGIEILPKYHYLAHNGILRIAGPFYNWLHTASGQGWLLKPIKDALPSPHGPNGIASIDLLSC